MGSEWKSGKLGDYVSSCLGKMLDKKKNKGDYQPYLGNSNVRWGYFELDNLSEMKFEPHELNRYGLKKGDLIVCEGGEPGRCAIWEEDVPTMMIQKALHRIRPFNELDSKYLFYWFLNAGRAGRLDPFFTGTTIKHLTGKALSQLPIDIPPMEHQRYSVNILSSLDDKIQLNKKTNQTLEQMAQALFKSWFVDFDPVFDNLLASVDFKLDNLETSLPDELIQKAQRRLAALNSLENATECKASLIALQTQLPTKAAEQVSEQAAGTPIKANVSTNPKILAQHANTHAHFPNEFVHNEKLGWIPKGWRVDSLSFLSKVSSGKRPPSKSTEVNDIDIFPVWGGNGIKWYTSSTLLDDKFIITGRVGTLGTVYKVFEPSWISDNALIIQPKNNNYFEYIYQCLNDFDIESLNSGSTQPLVTQTAIKKIEMLVTECLLLLEEFQRVCSSFENKHQILEKEIAQLTKLRDTLLPKLISGELHIPDVATDEEVVD